MVTRMVIFANLVALVITASKFKLTVFARLKPLHHWSFFQRHRKDVSNFDRQFTSEKTELSPTDKLFMMNLDQNEFAGFSFLNPEFVQHVWRGT